MKILCGSVLARWQMTLLGYLREIVVGLKTDKLEVDFTPKQAQRDGQSSTPR